MRIGGGQIDFAIWAIDPDSCCGQLFSNRRQTFGVTSQTVAVHHQHPVTELIDHIEIMGNEEIAQVKLLPQLPQQLVNVPNVDKMAATTNAAVQAAVDKESKLLGDTGRVLLRPSGTEPLVRVMAEAATQQQADEVCDRLAKVVADELAL